MTDEERIKMVAQMILDDIERQCEEGGAEAPCMYEGIGTDKLTSIGIDGRVNLTEVARYVLRGLGETNAAE